MITTDANFKTRQDALARFPKYKLLSYDPADSWESIINGTNAVPATDLTPYVTMIDYGFGQLHIVMADDSALSFHPDGGALRTKIRQGRIIRLKEGFEGLSEESWIWTFSGTVEGTYGWTYQRSQAIQIDFSAFDRSNNQAWRRRPITSRDYTVGADWGDMFYNIVHDIMGLSDTENNVSRYWSLTFDKNSNQIVMLPTWEALEGLLFGVNARPWFNGAGKLSSILTTQNRVTYTLPNDDLIQRYSAKAGNTETINKIILTYLSNQLSPVEGGHQVLGTAIVTTGFFIPQQDLDVYWSDDRRTRGRNTTMLVKQSVNGGLIPVGDESYQEIDEFHGRVTIEISSWVPVLATSLMAIYLAAAILPDLVVTLGFVASGGFTISVGRIIEAVALLTMLILMMSLGTGQYEVWGIPYEMVYLEQQHIAVKSGLEFWEEREREIKNQFVSTDERAKILALNALFFEAMKEQPRTITMRTDARLEPGDIIQTSTGVKFYIESVKKSLARGGAGPNIMELNCYRCVL